ncbi:MAG: type VI secretion system baseplate subunit TssF [Gammaproteobacteria bacterium]|nr:type VI secretion system baseplate subunit TssF [Gammaproteobacteria bacterium]
MNEKLIDLYEREMAYMQQTADEFSKLHPASAARLKLDTDTIDDPLVGRLFSGFAYMNARIQQKLSDEFPELTDAMLETLYPHYLRPIPSCAIIQFEPEPDLDKITTVEAGTLLQSEIFQGQTCRFTSCYSVDVCPFQVEAVSLMPRPFIAPGCNEFQSASSVLKVSLKTLTIGLKFSEINPEQLRFFLRGQSSHISALYDLLLSKCVQLVVANGEADPKPTYFNSDAIQQVGLEEGEGLLPYPDTAFIGYRLLTEYFAFPEKFYFIDIKNLHSAINESYNDTLNLYFYLSENHSELEKPIAPSMFALGCTPVVNLFSQTADPIPLTHTEYNYHVVPDARRNEGLEVYSIDQVAAVDSSGKAVEYRPFYGIQHSQHYAQQSAYWFSRRRDVVEGEHRNELATEVELSLVDLDFNPHKTSDQTLEVKLTCCNRNLAKKLPSSNGQPYFEMVDGSAPAKRISCVVPPTATLRPPHHERGYWRLISHLNLNHLSLTKSGGCEALKEIFRLYDFRDSSGTKNLIESLIKLETRAITAPIQIDHNLVLCRGTEVKIELDSIMLNGASKLLFASIIERFLGLYCSINSFTRLIASENGRDGELKRWPLRAGDKALL